MFVNNNSFSYFRRDPQVLPEQIGGNENLSLENSLNYSQRELLPSCGIPSGEDSFLKRPAIQVKLKLNRDPIEIKSSKSQSEGIKPEVPSHPDDNITNKVDMILSHCFELPVKGPTSCGIDPAKFYGVWGLSVLTSPGTDLITQWISFIISNFRNVDSYLTHQGYKEHAFANERQQVDCLKYLKARWAISALETLEKTVTSDADCTLIDSAKKKCEDLAKEKYETFASFVADVTKLPGLLGYFRDVGLSGLSTLNAPNKIAEAVLRGFEAKDLSVEAKNFLNFVPYLSTVLGMFSGSLSVIQGILEGYNGTQTSNALLTAELLDKELISKYQKDFGDELRDLMGFRDEMRRLEFWKAKWQKCRGAVRSTHGAVGLSTSTTALALLLAGVTSTATLGIPAIIGTVGAGLYLGWVYFSSIYAQSVQKRYVKALKTIKTNTNNKESPQYIPGLSTDIKRLSINEISKAFADKLAKNDTVAKTINLLVHLGIPECVVMRAAYDGGEELAAYLLTPNVSERNRVALNILKSKCTADQHLAALESLSPEDRKSALQNKDKKINRSTSAQVTPTWHQYLAPGAGGLKIENSKLTLKNIRKCWDEEGFQDYLTDKLSSPEPFESAGTAWEKLQSLRKHENLKEKASKTVNDWFNGNQYARITSCLQSASTDFLVAACKDKIKEVLQINNDLENITDERIKGIYVNTWEKTDLGVNNIGRFMALYRAASDEEKKQLRTNTLNKFIDKTIECMDPDDCKEFKDMLGLQENGLYPTDRNTLDAMPGKIHKFLLVSEKLQCQTLTKVIASLHEYPTDDSIPKNVARIAAIRELRIRCLSGDPADVLHTLALVKELSGEKLHKLVLGAGKGGGRLGFGGYCLNDKGMIVQELVERCLGGGSPIHSFSATMAKLLRATRDCVNDKVKGPAISKALTYWTEKLIGEEKTVLQYDGLTLADMFDLYGTPVKLENALKSTGHGVRDLALSFLNFRLTVAKKELEKAAAVLEVPKTKMGFDSSRFVTQMTEFFSLQKLAEKHLEKKYKELEPELSPEFRERLKFYRAALEWGNKTARAKNITAILWELPNLRNAGGLSANPFWSAKFLNANPIWEKNELNKLKTRYPWWSKTLSYKSFVKAVNKLDAMSPAQLLSAVKSGDSAGNDWIKYQFALRGLQPPEDSNLKSLKKQKTGVSLLIEILNKRDAAFKQMMEGALKRIMIAEYNKPV